MALAAGDAVVKAAATGSSLGLLVCARCRATVRAIARQRSYCPRCRARLHIRKPHSASTTAALLVSAAILYIPANLLPVMRTVTFFDETDDTIMSGVLALLRAGSWPLALLVFFASIVVPLLKLIAMGWLVYSAKRRAADPSLPRARLFRLVEFVGRWSMLDIFAIAVLAALVQFRTLAAVHVEIGALAFCAVVVLTMLAAQSFDERLLWDGRSDA